MAEKTIQRVGLSEPPKLALFPHPVELVRIIEPLGGGSLRLGFNVRIDEMLNHFRNPQNFTVWARLVGTEEPQQVGTQADATARQIDAILAPLAPGLYSVFVRAHNAQGTADSAQLLLSR